MSTVMVVTPIIIANWPVISAAVAGAVGSMGFTLAEAAAGVDVRVSSKNATKTEIELDDSEILSAGTELGEEMTVVRDGVTARFKRDARGSLTLCMEGEGYTKAELHQIGEELMGRVTQQYVYHRVMTEMKNKNMTIVSEEVDTDQTVHIRVKNW